MNVHEYAKGKEPEKRRHPVFGLWLTWAGQRFYIHDQRFHIR